MSVQASPTASPQSVGAIARPAGAVLPAAIAMMLGILIVGMAGFSHLDAVHNASHDTRHSNAFPCH